MNLSALVTASGSKLRYQEFASSGTFTPSAALIAAGGQVFFEGAGGGGGGAAPYNPGSGTVSEKTGTGGGGSYDYGVLTITSAQTITIGAGGAGGIYLINTDRNGANGGNTTIGALRTITGGTGGKTRLLSGANAPGGSFGQPGRLGTEFTSLFYGGEGGRGMGPGGCANSGAGVLGGGGGGSAANSGAAGAGGNGFVRFWWFE